MKNVAILRVMFVFALAVPLMVMLVHSAPLTIGVSQEWNGAQYHLSAGTSPWFLLIAVCISTLYLVLLNTELPRSKTAVESIVRRFFAFFLDFVIAMFVIAPVIGILPMLVEWKRTGSFEWHFERAVWVASDWWLTYAPMPLILAALFVYFVLPLMRGRPSPGACILGYQVVWDTRQGSTFDKATLRAMLCMLALMVWPISMLVGRNRKNGQFWVDKIVGTRAVCLE